MFLPCSAVFSQSQSFVALMTESIVKMVVELNQVGHLMFITQRYTLYQTML